MKTFYGHTRFISFLYDKHVKHAWVLQDVFIVKENMKAFMAIPHVHLIVLKKLESS